MIVYFTVMFDHPSCFFTFCRSGIPTSCYIFLNVFYYLLLYTIAYDHDVTCSLAPRLSILVPRSYSRPQITLSSPGRLSIPHAHVLRAPSSMHCSPSPCPIRSQDEVKEQQLESGLMVQWVERTRNDGNSKGLQCPYRKI